MDQTLPFRLRESQAYGWPFYAARQCLRGAARRMNAAADALSGREKYPLPIFVSPLLRANAQLKDIHRGRRCFILGNGPSLKHVDVDALAGDVTVAMNGFINHPAVPGFAPTYYCLADPVYFDGSAPSNDFLARLFQDAAASRFVLGCAAASHPMSARVKASYVTFAGKLSSCNLNRIDFTRPLPNITNCAQLAIMIALYAGCSPIYLLGMDHDWLAHRGEDAHFYPQPTLPNHPIAHGHYSRYPYDRLIEDVLDLWRGYHNLRRYAQKHNQRIVNCTDGGFLDAFERKRLDLPERAAA